MKRREILKSAGCVLFLPALESFGQNRLAPDETKVKRLFCVSMGYGLFTDVLPQVDGADYAFSEHMDPLKKHRDHFTLYSKMKFGGSHVRDHKCFVGNTATNPDSLDQIVASHVGHLTRVRNVVTFISHAHHHIVASWRNRLPVMPIQSTRLLFETLFAKTDTKTQERLLAHKKSVLDGSLEEAKALMKRVSGRDRQRLEEYFAALRESEQELNKSIAWLNEPRQDVEFPVAPQLENNFLASDVDKKRFLENPRQIQRGIAFDMIYKAFRFDITRVVNFYMTGLDHDHHITTHNVPKSENARNSLTKYDSSFYSLLSHFYDKLASTNVESGGTLMDETVTVATGNNSVSQTMGPHNGNEIPVFVAGGQFSNHGGHVIRKGETTCDIYLSILQQFGILRDHFGNSKRVIQL
ncbi:MAG: DUF1552 domain-containing protein [Planctomycetaceae bacterium]|jgi:hypothetical protein|nr:DUF1552 domain-containing protein [Planctomycetaceae bacterium]